MNKNNNKRMLVKLNRIRIRNRIKIRIGLMFLLYKMLHESDLLSISYQSNYALHQFKNNKKTVEQ